MKFDKNENDLARLSSIKQGDHHAFEILFKEYYLPLTRFAWRYLSCEMQAEEVVQDVFADIWDRRKHLNIQESLRSYLYKSVRNRSLNRLKRQEIKQEYDSYWMEIYKVEPMSEYEIREDEERIQLIKKMISQAIEELPPRSRMTFKLHRFDGLTYEEIAEVMNISVRTVESQMTRTLQILRKRLTILIPYLLLTFLTV